MLDLSAIPPGVGLTILALVGLIAGVVNTMAGGGGLLIIPVLIGLGVPPGVANGTLRVGVLVQNLASAIAFHRSGFRDYSLCARLLVPMMAGAAGGTWLATRLPDHLLRPIFGGVLALWAVILVLRPGRFLVPPPEPVPPRPITWIAALAVGVYGGFLQAGVGFPLLALLVPHLGYPTVRANGAKVVLVLGYTLVSLPMFALAGQVAWREAAALATGSLLGGWVGTRLQLRAGSAMVHWVIVLALLASGVAMIV